MAVKPRRIDSKCPAANQQDVHAHQGQVGNVESHATLTYHLLSQAVECRPSSRQLPLPATQQKKHQEDRKKRKTQQCDSAFSTVIKTRAASGVVTSRLRPRVPLHAG